LRVCHKLSSSSASSTVSNVTLKDRRKITELVKRDDVEIKICGEYIGVVVLVIKPSVAFNYISSFDVLVIVDVKPNYVRRNDKITIGVR
jgi:hypothetical protein